MLPREGDVIGKYRVERVLGRGAMGLVVAAQHTVLEHRVAMKFLLPEAMAIGGATARFLREAKAAAAIQSEHVTRVLDASTIEGGSPYLVMEYLTGVDLDHHLAARGPLPVAEAIDYVLEACEAIAEAHALGIIHRDLKPENLFLARREDGSTLVKVLDFGLSKPTRPDAPNALDASGLTTAHTMLGSPQYMSPEQIRCLKEIDGRTDIWSLGVILYELLSARFPFESDSLSGLFISIAADAPVPLAVHRPDLPVALLDVVMRCLEKDVSRRVQSVAELVGALAPFSTKGAQASSERISRVPSAPSARPRRGISISAAAVIASLVALATVATLRIVVPRHDHAGAPRRSSGSVDLTWRIPWTNTQQ